MWTTCPGGIIEFDEGKTGFFEAEAELFVHRQDHHGLAQPSVEFRQSFLWCFDTMPGTMDPGTTRMMPEVTTKWCA